MLQEARDNRNMPFLKRGMRCDCNGKPGRVTGGNSTHLRMRFDGNKFTSTIHPKWEMTYYAEDGSVIMDYKQAK